MREIREIIQKDPGGEKAKILIASFNKEIF
jgi:hypothetical protein